MLYFKYRYSIVFEFFKICNKNGKIIYLFNIFVYVII